MGCPFVFYVTSQLAKLYSIMLESELKQTEPRNYRDVGMVLLLFVLIALPFLQLVGFPFVNYDDPLHVSSQPAVIAGISSESAQWGWTATPSNLWHPLTWWSYMAEVSFFGGGAAAPAVHHCGNLLLHLAGCSVFYLLLRSLGVSLLFAGLGGLLFGLHPLQVEPVSWVSSRKDLLAGFFTLLSLLCYSRFSGQSVTKPRLWPVLTFLTLAAALLSKPSAVVLPCLFVLLDYVPRAGRRREIEVSALWLNVLKKWPYFLLAGVAATVALTVQSRGSHGGVIGGQSGVPPILFLPARLAQYFQHLLWPQGLCFDYAKPVGWQLVLLTVLGGVGALLLSRACWLRRHSYPLMFVAWAWFVVCLLPVLGVFYLGAGFTADRYTYVALAGPVLWLVFAVQGMRRQYRAIALTGLALLAITFAALSYQQTKVWKDDYSLFSNGVAQQPESGVAHTNLASYYHLSGQSDMALHHYRKALELEASHHIVFYNMAQIYRQQRETKKAIEACQKSLRSDVSYSRSHYLLGRLMLESSADQATALNHLQWALQGEPQNVNYQYAVAVAFAKAGRTSEAEELLRALLDRDALSIVLRRRCNQLMQRLTGAAELKE